MEREMKKYAVVEQAFQKIKAATGLGDAREIVNKFINREQTYSELLISIADYERKIEGLRKINEQLKGKIHTLKDANVPVEKARPEKSGDRAKTPALDKELAATSEKYKKAKLVVEKTYAWTIKTLQKLDKVIDKNYKPSKYYMDAYPRENIMDAFLRTIEIVKGQLGSIKAEESQRVMDDLERSQIDEEIKRDEFVQRNFRVKGSPQKLSRKKSRDESVGGSSKGNTSSRDEDFDFMDDRNSENDTVEDYNEDEGDLEKMRNEIRLVEAREREILRKKKLQEKKEKEGGGVPAGK